MLDHGSVRAVHEHLPLHRMASGHVQQTNGVANQSYELTAGAKMDLQLN